MTKTMKTIAVARTINGPTKAVWQILRSGADLHLWVPAISACSLEGTGVGARRVCVIGDAKLHETIETVDDQAQLIQYRIREQSMMPVEDVLGSIHVAECGPAKTHVLWFVNLTLTNDAAWEGVKAGIEEIYQQGLAGLETLVGARA